ncbi:MAG: 5'-3'-deoxyribonucleotidase [Solibacillus sp.]
MKKSIAIDMDQVLANLFKKLTVVCNEQFGTNYTEEQFLLTSPNNLSEADNKKFFELLNEPDFFRDLEVLDAHAIEVVKELQERFEIYIATAAMDVPGSFNAKYDWLREHMPYLKTENIVFCGNKAVIHTDYLIDDSPRQLSVFSGTGLLYSMPYNASATEFTRVDNWLAIRDYFAKVDA